MSSNPRDNNPYGGSSGSSRGGGRGGPPGGRGGPPGSGPPGGRGGPPFGSGTPQGGPPGGGRSLAPRPPPPARTGDRAVSSSRPPPGFGGYPNIQPAPSPQQSGSLQPPAQYPNIQPGGSGGGYGSYGSYRMTSAPGGSETPGGSWRTTVGGRYDITQNDPFASPSMNPQRTPSGGSGPQSGGSSSSKRSRESKTGSVIKGRADKEGVSLEHAYPKAFTDRIRVNCPDMAAIDLKIYYPWMKDPNPPSEDQIQKMKEKIDYANRQNLFVLGNSNFVIRTISDLFPDLDNRTTTFGALYDYGRKNFNNFMNEFVWNGIYGQCINYLKNRGNDFRLDPALGDVAKNMPHTRQWLYGQLDETVWQSIFKFVAKIAKWDKNFMDKGSTQFYFLRTVWAQMMMKIGEIAAKDMKLNPGKTWAKHMSSKDWKVDKNAHDEAYAYLASIMCHKEYRKIEISTFTWEPLAGVGDDVNEPATSKRRVEAILQGNAAYTTISPPPGSPVGTPPFGPVTTGPGSGSGSGTGRRRGHERRISPLIQTHFPPGIAETAGIPFDPRARNPVDPAMGQYEAEEDIYGVSPTRPPRQSRSGTPAQFGEGSSQGTSGPGFQLPLRSRSGTPIAPSGSTSAYPDPPQMSPTRIFSQAPPPQLQPQVSPRRTRSTYASAAASSTQQQGQQGGPSQQETGRGRGRGRGAPPQSGGPSQQEGGSGGRGRGRGRGGRGGRGSGGFSASQFDGAFDDPFTDGVHAVGYGHPAYEDTVDSIEDDGYESPTHAYSERMARRRAYYE